MKCWIVFIIARPFVFFKRLFVLNCLVFLKRPFVLNCLVFLFLTFLSPFAGAGIKADYFSLPKVVAIEERKYDRSFELAVGLGYFPSNAYNRYFSGSLSGFYKFSPSWGWEVFRFDAMREEETALKKELAETEFDIEVRNQNFGRTFSYP